jgi:hypothetical protein
MRRLAPLGLALLSLAFAPAPFRRPPRVAPDELSLSQMQGYWEFVRFDEGASVKGVRIDGDRWTYVNQDGSDNARYLLTVGKGRGPVPIDWREAEGRPPYFLGLVQRDGGTLRLIYQVGARPEQRPAAIASAPKGWRGMTLRKGGSGGRK